MDLIKSRISVYKFLTLASVLGLLISWFVDADLTVTKYLLAISLVCATYYLVAIAFSIVHDRIVGQDRG